MTIATSLHSSNMPIASIIPLPWVDSTKVAGIANKVSLQLKTDTPKISVRVLHLVNGEHFAGAERVQSHLGRCLPRYGVQADFACLKAGRFADSVEAAGGEWGNVFRYPMKHRFDLRVASGISQTAREGKFHLLHAHTPRSAMIASIVARRTGLPWVYHVHSPAARDSSQRLSNYFNAKIEKTSLRSCRHQITVSDSLRQELIASGAKADQVTVVRNGVPSIRYARKGIPQVGGTWTFGMVALMRARKGLEVALDALALLRDRGLNAKLRCIGPFETDDYRSKIESQIESLSLRDRVEQTGFKTDVPQALSQLDAMLLPSLFGEGLPMVVLEAMASALPVIATKVEGTPEAIRDGIDGLLAEPGSAESLADHMQALMEGKVDWSMIAESAFRRHHEMFSDFAMSEGVSKVYRSILLS